MGSVDRESSRGRIALYIYIAAVVAGVAGTGRAIATTRRDGPCNRHRSLRDGTGRDKIAL